MLSKKKLLSHCIIFSIVIGLLIVTGYFYFTRGVYVSITNNTDSILKNIQISYIGGKVDNEKMEPYTSYGQHINPTGEPHLELEWYNSSGTRQSRTIDVYFEHNYRGSIKITIDPNNQVSWTDKTKLPGLI